MEQGYVIGVDLGGTKIDVALMEMGQDFVGDFPHNKFKVVENVRIATNVEKGAEEIILDVTRIIRFLEEKYKVRAKDIGIAVAGQIDVAGEVVIYAPNLLWKDVPMKRMTEKVLTSKVVLLNDVRAATIGELCFGAGKEDEDFVCLFVGTGVGGGIVSGGKVLKGCNNSAGELGHIVVCFDCEDVCGCGNKGCLESLASGSGIARQARALARENQILAAHIIREACGYIDNIQAREVFFAAEKGDYAALKILQRAKRALVAGCVTIVNALNPKKLILGGGIMHAQPSWLGVVKQGVEEHALKTASAPLEIVFGALGSEAGIIGAAAAAKGRYNDH